MYPILFEAGPFTLRTYGVMIALGFLAALRMSKWAIRDRGIGEKFLMDLAIVLVLTGLVGARLFYVMLNGTYYLEHPLDSFKIWEGGLVFYGGFITAAVAGAWFAKRHHVSVKVLSDCLAPALAMGQAIGRWGCFFAGCCFGRPTEMPWAVHFKHPASLAPLNIGLHPVQIYEAMGNLAIAFFLWVRLMKKREAPAGQVFWLYVLLYGLLRFGIELLRGDDRGPLFALLYPSQAIALIAILVSASVLVIQTASPIEETHGSDIEDRKAR